MDKEKKNCSDQKSNQSGINENEPTVIRRRGKALESAILEAAWNELSDVGYNHLTMESVAARAKTNKAVLYRRWENKSKLVIAVLQKYLPKSTEQVPDTGSLRNDVIILLQRIAKPLETIGAETIHGLIVDFGKDLISAMPKVVSSGKENILLNPMIAIIKNAEKRGEVNLEKIIPRIISLPLDLLRYEILTTHEPISDKTISEIVDDIFIPLMRS